MATGGTRRKASLIRIPRLGSSNSRSFELKGRRIVLRALVPEDFPGWSEVRNRSRDWLVKWEPQQLAGYPDIANDSQAFNNRCMSRDREWQLGTGYGFGLFVDGRFAGEVNISGVQRGPFQNAYIGYWIDESQAGHGYVPEALVLLFRFAFEDLGLHRIQIVAIPRNGPSRRVMEKLEMRDEGIALRYLEINGAWEDHVRYAITSEEWVEKGPAYLTKWID